MQKIMMAATMAFLAVCACSCKKNSPETLPDPVVYDNYSQLKTGNYWIYQLYDVDSVGNGFAIPGFDSTYVSKDSVIHGKTYHLMVSTGPYYQSGIWLRDSLHYLVNVFGGIMFSSSDFTDTFLSQPLLFSATDTAAWVTHKMAGKDLLYSTPAGTYATSDFQIIHDMRPGYDYSGARRIMHKRFAKNIGVISETLPFYYADPKYREKRLVRYHLE